jgi:sarcosine oxidase subunit beta
MVNGNLLIGGTRETHEAELITTYEGITGIAQRAIELVPEVRNKNIIRAYSGVRNIPDDGLPILGFVGEVQGWINAVLHVGVTLAPVVGKLIAELIQEGRSSLDIGEFGLSRFNQASK